MQELPAELVVRFKGRLDWARVPEPRRPDDFKWIGASPYQWYRWAQLTDAPLTGSALHNDRQPPGQPAVRAMGWMTHTPRKE
jgi:hypothetical protein